MSIMRQVVDSVYGNGFRYGTETLEILDFYAPANVPEGNTGFTVTYRAQNNSNQPVNAYGKIINTQTNQVYGYWTQSIPVGGYRDVSVDIPAITEAFYGQVEIGHFAGGPPINWLLIGAAVASIAVVGLVFMVGTRRSGAVSTARRR